MPTDFDQVIDRRGTSCYKWDYPGGDVIPMWIADMDFLTPPAILEAIERRLRHGVFGYGGGEEATIAAVSGHYRRKYGLEVPEEWITLVPSVMPGATLAFRVGGGGILYSVPMYTHIRQLPGEARVGVTEVPLREENLHYTIDFEALEAAITRETTTLLVCNPHNPVGRVLTRGELDGLADFARRHDLLVVSDEIHCELILEGEHLPWFGLSQDAAARSITLSSAGKICNIPGLPSAFAIIPDAAQRRRYRLEAKGLLSPENALSMAALTAAFDGSCEEWKEELRAYLRSNRDYLEARIAAIPGLSCVHNEGTYLVWIDCRGTGIEDPFRFFLKEARVFFNEGPTYGAGGEGFVRLNIGCPKSQLKEALDRVEEALARHGAVIGGE